MAITNVSLITDALREINVISEIDTASAEQGSHALRKLNQMLFGWEVDGVKLGYYEQTSTADTCPIPDWSQKGVTAKLAIEIAPVYGATVSPELAVKADEGWSTILRISQNMRLRGMDSSHLGSSDTGYDIQSGY